MKQTIALMLALLLALSLVSCGGENPPADDAKIYTFIKDGTEIAIAAELSPILSALGKELDYDESKSCYFTGMDKIYFYAGFEIHTYPDESGKGDRVNRVILTDDTVETKEGIRIGSSEADVRAAYGEPTQTDDVSWTYQGKDMFLKFFFENGVVDLIQYLHPQATTIE